MTCREFAEFIMDYLDGELASSRRQAFEEHLVVCRNCVNYLEQYKQTVQAGKGAFPLADLPVPDEVPLDLVRAVMAARRQ